MKKHKKVKITIFVIVIFALFMTSINIIPAKKAIDVNPFLSQNDLPMIAAHRGGAINNPENTLKAYKSAVNEYHVDILESDLWLTKDNYLVYNHDAYIDRTSNVNPNKTLDEVKELCKDENARHYISDYTLKELKQFNFGYYFCDEEGNFPYQNLSMQEVIDNQLQIVEFSELFDCFYESNPTLLFILEIKNPGEKGCIAANIIDEALSTRYINYKNRVVIGTFHDEIQENLRKHHPSLLTGASTSNAATFIISEMLKVNIFANCSFACLQIPTSYNIKGIKIKLDKKQYIRQAHKRNIAVQYWTINDEITMRKLIDLKCDAIMSDDIKLLKQVIDSYKN
ncbi:MAG: hypothetical protein MR270_00810 [Erysipelotrichaceae bacterium]|nr:hypothetical protein [Erysipelotrichaceae bacterium]